MDRLGFPMTPKFVVILHPCTAHSDEDSQRSQSHQHEPAASTFRTTIGSVDVSYIVISFKDSDGKWISRGAISSSTTSPGDELLLWRKPGTSGRERSRSRPRPRKPSQDRLQTTAGAEPLVRRS